jgi:hypothetical protein
VIPDLIPVLLVLQRDGRAELHAFDDDADLARRVADADADASIQLHALIAVPVPALDKGDIVLIAVEDDGARVSLAVVDRSAPLRALRDAARGFVDAVGVRDGTPCVAFDAADLDEARVAYAVSPTAFPLPPRPAPTRH